MGQLDDHKETQFNVALMEGHHVPPPLPNMLVHMWRAPRKVLGSVFLLPLNSMQNLYFTPKSFLCSSPYKVVLLGESPRLTTQS